MDCSTPGFPVLHCLPELAQTHIHWVSDATQPSHPLLFPSLALNLSQHQAWFSLNLSRGCSLAVRPGCMLAQPVTSLISASKEAPWSHRPGVMLPRNRVNSWLHLPSCPARAGWPLPPKYHISVSSVWLMIVAKLWMNEWMNKWMTECLPVINPYHKAVMTVNSSVFFKELWFHPYLGILQCGRTESRVQSLFFNRKDLLQKEMATHSTFLAWEIPWMEESGRLQSTVSQRVGHDWETSLSLLLTYGFCSRFLFRT